MTKARKILFSGAVYGLLAVGGLLLSNQRAAAIEACGNQFTVSQANSMDCTCGGARGTVTDTTLSTGSHLLEVNFLQAVFPNSFIAGWGWPDGRQIRDATLNDGSVALLQAQNYEWIGCVVQPGWPN